MIKDLSFSFSDVSMTNTVNSNETEERFINELTKITKYNDDDICLPYIHKKPPSILLTPTRKHRNLLSKNRIIKEKFGSILSTEYDETLSGSFDNFEQQELLKYPINVSVTPLKIGFSDEAQFSCVICKKKSKYYYLCNKDGCPNGKQYLM